MGSRNLDRIHISERRRQAETIADMWKGRWRLRAYCPACGVELGVNLLSAIKLNGPDLVLWNKTTRCTRILEVGHRCQGRMVFKALAPGAAGFDFLGPIPPARRPAQGPFSAGRGAYIDPRDIEPDAVAAARGPGPPDPE